MVANISKISGSIVSSIQHLVSLSPVVSTSFIPVVDVIDGRIQNCDRLQCSQSIVCPLRDLFVGFDVLVDDGDTNEQFQGIHDSENVMDKGLCVVIAHIFNKVPDALVGGPHEYQHQITVTVFGSVIQNEPYNQ